MIDINLDNVELNVRIDNVVVDDANVAAAVAEADEQGDSAPDDTAPVLEWNEQLSAAIRASGTGPAATTRTAAMFNVAIYDAVNGIDTVREDTPSFEPYHVDPADAPPRGSRAAAAAAAAHEVLTQYYPSERDRFDGTLDDQLEAIVRSAGFGPVREGTEWGRTVASELIDLRGSDGWEASMPYEPGDGPGEFRGDWGSAHLADVDTWGISDTEQFAPPGPPKLDSPDYAASWQEVYDLGEDTDDRPPEHVETAAFWRGSAGTMTPGGRWVLIAMTIAAERDRSVSENARLFALLCVSIADAAITTWDSKRKYNSWRPRTAIHEANADGNPDTYADKDWDSLALGGSPDYLSGLATMGAAGKTVLEAFFDEDLPFELTVYSGLGPDELTLETRSFENFQAALEQSIDSRVFVGNHFRFSLEDAAAVGERVASEVLDTELRPVDVQ